MKKERAMSETVASTRLEFDPNEPPSVHGRYSVRVAVIDALLRMSIFHVDKRWMPFSIFGRCVQTNLIRVSPESAGESLVLRHGADGLVLNRLNGGALSNTLVLSPRWPSSLRDEAHDKITAALQAGDSGGSGLPKVLAWVFGVLFFMFMLVKLGAPSPTRPQHLPALPQLHQGGVGEFDTANTAAIQAPVLSEAEQLQMSSALAAQRAFDKSGNLPLADALAKADKIILKPIPTGGKGIVVWADPLCPHCRDFEQEVIDKLPADIGVTVVPVAYRDGSRPLVSYIVCGTEDRASRWSGLMAASPTGAIEKQCANGPRIADDNSTLFMRAGLRNTPTVTSADGSRIYEGELTEAAVELWSRK
jgi:hypothetical protein